MPKNGRMQHDFSFRKIIQNMRNIRLRNKQKVIYFDHKITKLEKRLTPFRHISSILSLSLPGLSIPVTPTISRKPSVFTGTRFSPF